MMPSRFIGVVINSHTHQILRIIYPDFEEELDDPLHTPETYELLLRVRKEEFDQFGLQAFQQILYAKASKRQYVTKTRPELFIK